MAAMKDIDEIRRTNILILEKEAGGATQLAARVGMELAQYLNLRDGAKDSKTGKRRGMKKETAWRFDDAGHRHRGWLNEDHSNDALEHEAGDIAEFVDPLISDVLGLMKKMSREGKMRLIERATVLAEQYPAQKQTPKSSR
jgi:hypothetical protein